MEVYLDNAATTKPSATVREAMLEAMEYDYANPSSLHKKGWEAERKMTQAREVIADSLKCDKKEVIFLSGGTEANNLAILGTAYAKKREGKHVLTTRIEHPSVGKAMKRLQEEGYEVTYIGVDANGRVDEGELRDAVREDTVLASIMSVNNEIGSLQDMERITSIIKSRNEKVIVHTDAVQAYGKARIHPKRLGVDLLSASAHKIHGPKGVGFLYKRDAVKLIPLLLGGGQEKDMRSGTENLPGIVGFGKAVGEAYRNLEEATKKLLQIKERLVRGLLEVPGTMVNAVEGLPLEETAAHIVSASFQGVKSEVLLHALEERGVYVSSGSACSSNHPSISATLQAIGVEQDRLDSTLRFSHSIYTSIEEVEYVLQALKELLPLLSKYKRK